MDIVKYSSLVFILLYKYIHTVLHPFFKINFYIELCAFSVQKCLQGLNIAKMYYEAGEMEESLK